MSRFCLSKRISTNLIKVMSLWAFNLERLDKLIQVDSIRTKKNYRFSSKFDLYSMLQHAKGVPAARVYGVYKPKARKVRPVDSSETMGLSLGKDRNEKTRIGF